MKIEILEEKIEMKNLIIFELKVNESLKYAGQIAEKIPSTDKYVILRSTNILKSEFI